MQLKGQVRGGKSALLRQHSAPVEEIIMVDGVHRRAMAKSWLGGRPRSAPVAAAE
jgi:hypothetical protein